MTTPNPFFLVPFASSGNAMAVPNTGGSTGTMSYEYGFTPNYEANLETDPSAIPIPRQQMNQLFFDITNALNILQTQGLPNWVAPGGGIGIAAGYPLNALVNYSGVNYISQVASNMSVPGADANWLATSGGGASLPVGSVIDFAGMSAPFGFLSTDGSALARTGTYAALMAAITGIQNGTTIRTQNTLTGLSSTTQMYVGMPLEGAGIPTGTTVASVTSSTSITMSNNATASATVPVTFFPWGNGDGSTTFNIPVVLGSTTIGQNGQNATGNQFTTTAVGQTGGQATHTMTPQELANHTHDPLGPSTGFIGVVTSSAGISATGSNEGTVATTGNVTSPGGTATPFNVMQPSVVMYKCIKYLG